MTWISERAELKLDMLHSLARSQKALARMIESLADVTEQSIDTAAGLRENIRAIAEYQRTMAEKVAEIELPDTVRRSTPSSPWTNGSLRVCGGSRMTSTQEEVESLRSSREQRIAGA
ncbi:hypothetical protein [Paenibacillus koleovorans]|uniref:hypothetical protein n=1 Tax=Paenibacillus koleovorans TaxID=121608 RepID=UPI000FD7AA56|nr:hypothetical protein [Paenibacillus koleovorans]